MELGIIDLFAREYGWSKNQIMNEVYLDEYFTQRDIIQKRQRQEYLKQAQLQILPNLDKKAIDKFFKELTEEDRPSLVGKEVKTDFEALKRAKEKQKHM